VKSEAKALEKNETALGGFSSGLFFTIDRIGDLLYVFNAYNNDGV